MFSLIHKLRAGITFREGLVLLVAMVIAELFYKFHSFTLECVAFLATWYVLGGVAALIGIAVEAKRVALERKR